MRRDGNPEDDGGQPDHDIQTRTASALGEGAAHGHHESQSSSVRSLSEVCDLLANAQAKRRFCIGQQSRLNNALGALARWQLGWKVSLPEAERERIRKDAAKLVKAVQDGELPAGMEDAAETLLPYVQDTAIGRTPFDLRRKEIEKEMRKLVRDLPAYEFAESVKGFGDLALAVIVGEAGNLANYPHWQHLWKRLGWAPREEYPKGEKSEGRKVPRRVKGELYGTVIEPLMKLNGDGKYKALYDRRKADYLARFEADGSKTPKLHAHKLAMRVMLKELLKDLWKAWNGQLDRDDQT